jgi:hypothetical protein
MTLLAELQGLPKWARYDGATFDALIEARYASPKTIEDLSKLPKTGRLPMDVQLEIWQQIHPVRR